MQRITQGMVNTQYMRNLNNNLNRMNVLQEQMSTSRKINRPSDDPVGLSYALRYRSELGANEQYQENVSSAISWLEYTDTMLSQAGEVLNKARELSVQAANGTNSVDALQAVKSEMKQLYEQLVTIGNSSFNGKYIFNGQKTDIPPYTSTDAVNQNTDEGVIRFDVGGWTTLSVNVDGNQAFGSSASDTNAFKLLKDTISNLEKSDFTAISAGLGKMDERITAFLEVRADIGAKTNRINLANERLQDAKINLSTLQSSTEDADMAETITGFNTDQSVYQASLSMGAKILQSSLLDYLR